MTFLTLMLGSGVRELPVSAHVIAGVAVLVGLYVWAQGQGTLRLALALIAGVAGAAAGFFALGPTLASLGLDVHPVIPAGGLGLAAMLTAALLLKIANAVVCAVVISSALTVGAFPFIAAAEDTGQQMPELNVPGLPSARGVDPSELSNNFIQPTIDEETREAIRSAGEKVQAFVASGTEDVRTQWSELAVNQKLLIGMVGVFGLIVGFGFGMIFSKFAGMVTTTLAGAALMLAAGAWLVTLAGGTVPALSAIVWLTIWGVVALVGMVIQATGTAKASTPAAKGA